MLSDNIRELRKRNNMSQDELAEKLGVSRQSVSLWETGQTQPTLDNIIALAKIFNVSTDAILGNKIEEKKITDDCETDTERKKGVNPAIIIVSAAGVILIAVLIIFLVSKLSQKNDGPSDTESGYTLQTDTVDTEPEESDLTEGEVTEENGENTVTEEENAITVMETETDETTETEPQATKAVTETETEAPVTETVKETEAETSAPETKPDVVTEEETKNTPQKQFDLYAYLKDFILKNGTVSGTCCAYRQPSTLYGGYENEYFDAFYWSDYEKIELSLWCPLDDTFSITFYLIMRGKQESTYEYTVSKYYRDTGESVRYVKGYLDPSEFSSSSPLKYDSYIGSTQGQDSFLEESRVGICDLIKLIKNFVTVEKLDCDFSVFGFKNF